MSDPVDQPTDARARLLSHFEAKDTAAHPEAWDELWADGFIPWDKGFPSPALADLLEQRKDLFPTTKERKKAFVPGCGKGYDVLLLSAWGYDAYGLDFSPTAIERAKELEKEVDGKGPHYETQQGVTKGKVVWVTGDFFKDDFLEVVDGENKFDLIYDYTFLSALNPSMRPAWSSRYNELLAPTGKLICLEFPTYKPPSTGGPPWALPPKIYMAHLPRPGEKLLYEEDGDLLESKLGEPSNRSLTRIEHFQPQRTHNVGYGEDGKVTDWISVWSHKR
ncbi:thiol methyltransferas-like protein [Calycina marina]|uniref:Thiol methyltransferas-like protein n=1 Tax=Calycina marina TaxID=1763456 RepID=A0A9P8CE35_9HELO|nr:thiol methyltransferas-like protein [Calycina marina]